MTPYGGPDGLKNVLNVLARTLQNGLRVLTLQLPHLHAVSHALMVRSGPRYETETTNGISHLVEHLIFRGTKEHRDSYSFNVAVEDLGAEINGMTQRDATTIHMTVPPRSAVKGLGLLGEVCTRPLLTGLDVERDVVMEELLDTMDALGSELDLDAISRRILWASHPISLPIAGTIENLERFTEAQCRTQFESTFVAENSVLCVAGPIDAEAIFEEAARSFGRMPRGVRSIDGPVPVPVSSPPIHVQPTDDSQVSVLLSFPAPHENDPEFATLLLLRRLLDDGLGSRLRQEVCEQRGLAYSLSAAIDAYSDAAILDIDLCCAPRKLVSATKQVLATLDEVVNGRVHSTELERAKTRHRADLEFALDDPSEMCGWYGATEIVGCSAGYEERLSQAMAVTPDRIHALARNMFERDRGLLTLVGPVPEEAVRRLESVLGRKEDSTVWLGNRSSDSP